MSTFMIRRFIYNEQGQDIVEYSLLLVLIGLAGVFILTAMGQSIGNIFEKISSKLSAADEAIAN